MNNQEQLPFHSIIPRIGFLEMEKKIWQDESFQVKNS